MNKIIDHQAQTSPVSPIFPSSNRLPNQQAQSCSYLSDPSKSTISAGTTLRKHSISLYSQKHIEMNRSLSPQGKITKKVHPKVASTISQLYPPAIYHQPNFRSKYFCSIVDQYMGKESKIGKEPRSLTENIATNKSNKILPSNLNKFQQNNTCFTKMNKSDLMILNEGQKKNKLFLRREKAKILPTLSSQSPQKPAVQKLRENNLKFSPQNLKNPKYHFKKFKIKPHFISGSSFTDDQTLQTVDTRLYTQQVELMKNSSCYSSTSAIQLEEQTSKQLTQSSKKIKVLSRNASKKQNPMFDTSFQQQRQTKSPEHSRTYIRLLSISSQQIFEQLHPVDQFNQIQKSIKNQLQSNMDYLGIDEWKLKKVSEFKLFTVFYLSGQRQNGHYEKVKVKYFGQGLQSQQLKSMSQKVNELKVSNMWNPLQSSLSRQKCHLYLSKNVQTLRQTLFKFKAQQPILNQPKSFLVIPTIQHSKLFHNNCEQLRDIILSIAQDLCKMQGKLINNKLTLDNVFRLEQKCIVIGDWQCSASNRKFTINGSQICMKEEPVVRVFDNLCTREDRVQWICEPESMPPQVINSLISQNYNEVWEITGSPQVWCLGIMILQILTAVPVWMPSNTIFENRKPRKGYFHDVHKRMKCIYSLQTKIVTIVNNWMRDQKNEAYYKNIHPQIISLMKAMLQMDPKLRPTPRDIVDRLKKI